MDIHVGWVDAILAVGLIVSFSVWVYLVGVIHGLRRSLNVLNIAREEMRQKRIAMLSGDAHTTKEGTHHG